MNHDQIKIMITMIAYMLIIVGVGVFFFKRANASTENFFLGGRTLGPWVTAMSAEASDMSGWLLMGLPGVAYWMGLSDAFWTALGLGLGTYINWLIVSKRLRCYSEVAGNSITLPEFFSKRFKEDKPVLMTVSALFILVFFTVYASSCFVTVGKLFSALFNVSYFVAMVIGAVFVVLYTVIGGFLAESVSDFIQAIVMIFALVTIVGTAIYAAGGVSQIVENVRAFPGFLEFFGMASPVLKDGAQVVQAGVPQFEPVATPYTLRTIVSTMSWGLGYFGMPQVLLRFMAIRHKNELTASRRIATVWVFISLFAAVVMGLMGRALFPTALGTASQAENILITMSTNLLPAVLAGLVMAGILAATISSSDSYLLIASSSVAKNLYQGIFKKDATDRHVMIVSRITLLLIAVVSMLIALDENSIIFQVVSFAWAGFGATFGPVMLFLLFWKRVTRSGAVAGMVAGGSMVFIWKLLLRPLGGALDVYELLPAFLISCLAIVLVSLLTKKPSAEIQAEFEHAKAASKTKEDLVFAAAKNNQ